MTDDLEARLRRSLAERSGDPVPGESALPHGTRRRARMRRATNATSAALAVAIVLGSTLTFVNMRTTTVPAPVSTLPDGSPTRVPEPSATAAPPPETVPESPATSRALARVASVPDAGAKIAAHGHVWVVAATRVLRYTESGSLAGRVVASRILGEDAVLEPRVLAADDSGVWVAGAGDIAATLPADACAAIEPLGGDRPGEAFVLRLDASSLCPSVLIDLGVIDESASGSPGLVPQASQSPSAPSRSRFVRWHGLAASAGSLWIGADGGMVRADLEDGSLDRIGIDAYSVGVGFGSVWAAVSQDRDTPRQQDFIARIDPDSGEVVARIDVPPRDPSTTTSFAEVHVGPDAVWAEGWGVVAQVDPRTNSIVERYEIGGDHLKGDMASGGGRFYLADNGAGANGFWVIDAASRSLRRKVSTRAEVTGLAVVGDRLWFSSGGVLYRMTVE